MEVEPDAPVFDVVDVVLDAGGEVGVAAEAVDLRPAGHAGFDEVAREVVRDLAGELVDVIGALGARADEAHVAAEDVPELGKLVDVPATKEGADAEKARVAAGGGVARRVGGGGVGSHAAKFVEREGAMAGADAGLAEEDGAAGRFAFDEGGGDENDGGGKNEADERAGDIDGAFERAGEKAVDGEGVDAEDGDASDGLQAEAAEKDVEGARHDFPFDVAALAEIDDALEVGAGEVELGGDEDVGAFALEDVFEVGEGAESGRGIVI